MGMVLQAGGVAGLVGADFDRGFLRASIHGHRSSLAFSIRHAVWNFSVLGVGGNSFGLGGVANFGTGSLTNCQRSESLGVVDAGATTYAIFAHGNPFKPRRAGTARTRSYKCRGLISFRPQVLKLLNFGSLRRG